MIKTYLLFVSCLLFNDFSFAQNSFPSSGNVGIGTTNPLATLGIKGNSVWGTVKILPTADNGETGIGFSSRATEGDYSRMWFMGIGGWNNGQNFTIGSAVHGSPSMTFLETGNVGIGTNNPAYKLDVQGGDVVVYNAGKPSRVVAGSGITNKTLIQLSTSADENGYGILQSVAASNVAWGNTVINPNGGNVGIGTTAPDARLSVNGTVHAKEIKVDLNVPGADYVFEKSYPLLSLAAVNKYISAHHRLPDVPSAKSMEKNGIDVSVMNMKLLQKVEELTLYLIEVKKENAQLNKRLKKLENKK